ncbi:MAG: HAD family hydrolase [Chitinispirillaceae bacterium]|nr:HAD family hydrolase [Chitinispirillaceae bacterium]
MTVRAIIFDLDGTLLNTLGDIAFSMNAALATFGAQPLQLEQYRRMVGQGLDMLARLALPAGRRDDATVTQCVAAMRAVYADRWAHSTRPYPGIIETLDALKKRGIVLAVNSNKLHDFTLKMATHFFGPSLFHTIIGGGKFPYKPDPAAALHIANAMGSNPGDLLYVGDSDIDLQTAKNARMCPVGVTWGFRTREELQKNGAMVLIDHPEELLHLIDRLNSTC